MATNTRIISLCSKTKNIFCHNKNSVSTIFLQKMILPAVAIKLYCLKLFFKKRFCFNNRTFVFSIIDNYFALVAKATKFEMKPNSFAKFLQPAKFQTNRAKDSWDIALSFFHCLAVLGLWRHISMKLRLKTCSNFWLWNGISWEPFDALRSVMARFLAFLHDLVLFELKFFSTGVSFLR